MRRILGAVVVFTAVLSGITIAPSVPAGAVVPGSVSGVITAQATGDPLANVLVAVYSDAYIYQGQAQTSASGEYTVSGLSEGTAKVRIHGTGAYAQEWYGDMPDFATATPITVVGGADTTGIDASLAIGGSISGTVTEVGTGDPISGIGVEVYGVEGPQDWLATANTDASGDYTVVGLPAGSLTVLFAQWSSYSPEWFDNQPFTGNPTPVPVTLGSDTPGIDADLGLAGSIAGKVVIDASGNGIPYSVMNAFDTGSGDLLASTEADAGGNYQLTELIAGSSVVLEGISTEVLYGYGWYGGGTSIEDATPITVIGGTTPMMIDVPIVRGSWLEGTVAADGSGALLSEVCVWIANNDTGLWEGNSGFTANGYYQLGLLPGSYSIYFRDCSTTPTYVSEWWDDAPTFPSATSVVVPDDGTDLGPFNAALAPNAGSISGSVTDWSGAPIPGGVCVTVRDATGGYFGGAGPIVGSVYTVPGLPTGVDLRIRFDDCLADEYGRSWFDGQSDVSTADLIVLAPSEARTGVNGILGSFPDVPRDHWGFDHIEAIFAAGFTSGNTDGTYQPEGLVSRSEMAVFLVRALDGSDLVPPKPVEDPFPDVPVSHWASGWINRLKDLGITAGNADGTYQPEGQVNRAEMAVFLDRAIDGSAVVPPKPVEDPFPDVPVSHWASGWIDRLVDLGITAGYSDGTYRPDRLVNRAEMATFLDRAFLGG